MRLYRLITLMLGLVFASSPLIADKSAVVLMYHRFGEEGLPSTNIRLDQLETHITILKTGGYTFMSLGEAVRLIKERQPFPDRSIIISVDDAFASVFHHGWPRLKAADIPMTLFVSTDPIDQHHSNYMTWDMVRQLQREGVEIGHHTASHLHMVAAGVEAAKTDVARASKRFLAELGEVPNLFAYPYGEYSPEMIEMIKAQGFEAAFSQFSGPIAASENLFALPRFPVNERYGGEERFKLISQAIALPVSDVVPQSSIVDPERNPPVFGFSVDNEVRGLSVLACYPSHMGEPAELLRPVANRIEVRFEKPFPKGRNRINCTMPAGKGRWYWYGRFFLVPGGPLD